jgi:hypothetical protein
MTLNVRVFSNDTELLNYALTHSTKTPIFESKSPNLKLKLSDDGYRNACVYFKDMKIALISYWGSFLINLKNIGLLNQEELNELAPILNTVDLYSVVTHHLGYTSQDPSYVSYKVATACVKEKKKLGYIATIKKEITLLHNK